MGQVLIRNIDDSVIAAYRDAAERNARWLEAELRDVLSRMRPRTLNEIAVLHERARQLRAMTPNVPQTSDESLSERTGTDYATHDPRCRHERRAGGVCR